RATIASDCAAELPDAGASTSRWASSLADMMAYELTEYTGRSVSTMVMLVIIVVVTAVENDRRDGDSWMNTCSSPSSFIYSRVEYGGSRGPVVEPSRPWG